MAIALATTTISVQRLPADTSRDGYDDVPARTTVKTGLRAVIGSPSGRETITTGNRTVATFTLNSDPFDFEPTDRVTDEATGDEYDVIWTRTRSELIPHTEGRLQQASGAA